ncbi:MAG TPA: zinc metalloprotease [Chitinophagaceae bacterium]|nr:zinc metalloprotease [Chitinophagaceae bacterium]
MKKKLLTITAVILLITSCNKSTAPDEQIEKPENFLERNCASPEVLQNQLSADPSLGKRMQDIEIFTERFIKNPNARRLLLPDSTIEIPVVVNVIYRTIAENISLAQIQSQIDVLNEDFSATNTDYNNIPALFQGVGSGNIDVRFVLDTVIRKSSAKTSWSTNNAMKSASSGGIDATSPATKLNLWVVNKMVSSSGNTVLGYAQFPGGPTTTDGVVIGYKYLGRTGTVVAPFDKGRTATHEVGHWMNLRHIWGDATCGNDQVGDTPQHNTANYGCPAAGHTSTCTGTPVEMTMNYMDYTDDACMYMFSSGQKDRMLAIFATGGPRNSFAQP